MVRSCSWCGVIVSWLLFASSAHAQCTKDTDCKGDRVCDAGACKSPASVAPDDPNGWGVAPAPQPGGEAESAPAAPAKPKATAAAPVVPTAAPPAQAGVSLQTREPSADVQRAQRPKTQRHSVGMMAAGIVMVSVSPIPLMAGLIYSIEGLACRSNSDVYDYENQYRRDCSGYGTAATGLTLGALALIGVGVPLIVIGGKREPVKEPWQAEVAPYATPEGAGFRLRLQL